MTICAVQILIFVLLVSLVRGDSACVGGENHHGICQCNVGYAASPPVDPTNCTYQCNPPPMTGALPSDPEELRVYASNGHLVLDVTLVSFADELSETVAFFSLTNGTRCSILPGLLGTRSVEQHIINEGCKRRLIWKAPFTQGHCWDVVHEGEERVTFRSAVEIVQQGRSSFRKAHNAFRVAGNGKTESRAVEEKRNDKRSVVSRTFRREVRISVLKQFTMQSSRMEVAPDVGFRVVMVDYFLKEDLVVVQIQSRVYHADGHKELQNLEAVPVDPKLTLKGGSSTGCQGYPTDVCVQTHTLSFSTKPECKVNTLLKLKADLSGQRIDTNLKVKWDACART